MDSLHGVDMQDPLDTLGPARNSPLPADFEDAVAK